MESASDDISQYGQGDQSPRCGCPLLYAACQKRPTCARWCPWHGMAQQSNKCLLLFVSKGRRGAIDVLCSNIYLCTVKYYWSTRWAQGAFQSGHASTHTSVLTPLPAIPPHTGRPSTTPTPLAILPHIAMQLVLIDILSFPPCPLPFTDIYDIRYQYID